MVDVDGWNEIKSNVIFININVCNTYDDMIYGEENGYTIGYDRLDLQRSMPW